MYYGIDAVYLLMYPILMPLAKIGNFIIEPLKSIQESCFFGFSFVTMGGCELACTKNVAIYLTFH